MVPYEYRNITIPIRDFLQASRAHSDAKRGIDDLVQSFTTGEDILLSNWKVRWIGCLALLRSSVDMLSKETRGCLPNELKESLKIEWKLILEMKEEHAIYWEFLKKERDQIIHEYEWGAYEVWLDAEGNENSPSIGTLLVSAGKLQPVLRIRKGKYKGTDAMEIISIAEKWVDDRIVAAIERAGFQPMEKRRLDDFGVVEPIKGGLFALG